MMKKALRWNVFLRMKNPIYRHFVDKLVLGVNFLVQEYNGDEVDQLENSENATALLDEPITTKGP